MSTKQLRITGTTEIRNRAPELLGKIINVVLSDGSVMHGKLMAVQEIHLTLKNMRLKSTSFPLKNILEIYSDTKA